MNKAKISGAFCLVAIAVTLSPVASAIDSGWYVGANIGQSRADIDDVRINRSLLGSGFATTSMNEDERSTAGKIFGGYQFNRYFAAEGGYFNLGKFAYTASTLPAGTLSGNIKVQGFNLDVVGILPLTEKFSAFGRAGVIYSQARDNFNSTGLVNRPAFSTRERDTGYKFGVGIQYAFTDRLALRGEVERYRINDAVGNKGDIDLASVGLIYRFGEQGQRPTPVLAPQVIAMVPPVPQPSPLPRPAPAPMPLMKVTFSADSLFGFNQSVVSPSGKQALDKFAAELKGVKYEVVKVTGHTDRIGSHSYNMKLSTRRAEAVKSYLSASTGIPVDKITAIGVNGAEPVTKAGDCVGTKPSKKLFACLQPDRRVEVEVSGTR